MTPPPRVAFLGLGAIGRPMAARVAARYPLTVWNRTGSVTTEFVGSVAAQAAASPADAVRDADVVMACLSTSRDVEAVLASGGTEAALKRGSLFLDCTSGDPATSRAIAARLAANGVAFADCPVSGGTNGAEAGVLTVMVGAEPAVFERARPLLETFGKLIVRVGDVGAGDTIKAVNQALLASNILSLAEGLTAMVKAGVEPRRGLEVINASSGRSFVSEKLVPERVLTGTWPNTFRLALMDKDVGIAMELIGQLGLEAPVLDRVKEILGRVRSELGEGGDYLEAIRLAETKAGVEIRG